MKIIVLGTRGFPGVQGGVESHCENSYPKGGDAVVTLGTGELSRAWTQLS